MWTEIDLTVGHACLITLISGRDAWSLMNPFAGPATLMQILAAFISAADHRPVLEVVAELGEVPLKRLLDAVSIIE